MQLTFHVSSVLSDLYGVAMPVICDTSVFQRYRVIPCRHSKPGRRARKAVPGPEAAEGEREGWWEGGGGRGGRFLAPRATMEQMLLKFLQPISDSAVEAIEACLAAAIVHPAIIMFGSTPAIMRLLLPHTCERLEKKSARAEQERERRKEVEDVRIVKRRLFGTDGKESAHVEAMLAEKERESQWALEKSKQLARRIKKLEDSAMQTSNEVQAGVAGGTARRHLRRPTRY